MVDRAFSIDIAFPDIKIGIEVNGNQHYNNDGSLKQYYQQRHDLIVDAGWTLIELHYLSCYDTDVIDNLLTIKEQPNYDEYFKQKENKSAVVVMERGRKILLASDEKWEPFKQIVQTSGIDFSRFGWATKVATLLNIKVQHVNRWMKRYLPELYDTICFKRNR